MHLERALSTNEKIEDLQDLVCPVCMTVAEDPHLTSCCHRIFCAKDADANKYNNRCPLCREENFTFNQSENHKKAVEKSTVKCSCSERYFEHQQESHQERCTSIKFPCPHSSCREQGSSLTYNSQELVNHLARAHCNEVPILGSTFVNKTALEKYKRAAVKYDALVSTLFSEIYPKMIEIQLTTSPGIQQTSNVFKCPAGHTLLNADHAKRKRRDGTGYSSVGFCCDQCHRSFSTGSSWHCSCTRSGFDKCVGCVVFDLYSIQNDTLQLANADNEEQQRRYTPQISRNTVRLPRGLFRLLAGPIDDDDDDDDNDDMDDIILTHEPSPPFQNDTFQTANEDNDGEVNMRQSE